MSETVNKEVELTELLGVARQALIRIAERSVVFRNHPERGADTCLAETCNIANNCLNKIGRV